MLNNALQPEVRIFCEAMRGGLTAVHGEASPKVQEQRTEKEGSDG
jgi:hypothetical protein